MNYSLASYLRNFGEERELGPERFRPFYANQGSELNLPIFSGKNDPKLGRKRDLYEPLRTAMAQVPPFLSNIFVDHGIRYVIDIGPENLSRVYLLP